MLENKADMDSIINDRYRSSTIKTDKNTTYNFRLKVKHRLSAAIKMIPSNAIINKGRCGVGGTYLEIIAERNSIIVVPTNAIIDDKCFVKNKLRPNYYIVRGAFDEDDFVDLRLFIESDKPNKKIFSTPEGLRKIATCGADEKKTYKDWFLLFDEAHTPISDNYRKNILDAFQFFFNFENRALISATPFRFSDPRFQKMDVYNIRFKGFVNRIKIINTNNVLTMLYSMLKDDRVYPGRVHIFLNSVMEISNVINRAELKSYSIYCKGDRKNINKLDRLHTHMFNNPSHLNFSKFNFYTSKYFEGWDLNDANSTMIVVSNYKTLTLKSGVSNKCVQAAGRNRMYSKQVFHLTNSRLLDQFKPVEEIQSAITETVGNTVKKYNEHIHEANELCFAHDGKFEALAKDYADIHYRSKLAKLNTFKIDQFVNQEYSNQEFNHVAFIIEAWKNAFYKVEHEDLLIPCLPDNIAEKNITEKVKATVKLLDAMHSSTGLVLDVISSLLKEIPLEKEDIIAAYNEIGPNRMEEFGYRMKVITREVIESKNEKAKFLIKKAYSNRVGGKFMVIKDIRTILDGFYEAYELRNPGNGKVKSANARDLETLFGKRAQATKVDKVNGFRILPE